MSTRKSEDVSLLYEGCKTFWKTRTTLKIQIVHHIKFSCLELICFDASTNTEFPRIYMDTAIISMKLDKEIINQKFIDKKETLNRQKKTVSNSDIVNDITMDMTMQYAFVRIHVPSEKEDIEVTLLPSFDDKMVPVPDNASELRIDVVCDKPEDLIPFQSVHQVGAAVNAVEDFHRKMSLVNIDQQKSLAEVEKATRLASLAMNCFIKAVRRKSLLCAKGNGVTNLDYSVARWRWIHAINKTIVINYVAAVRKRLDEISARVDTVSPDGPDGVLNMESLKTRRGGPNRRSFDDSDIHENFALPWGTDGSTRNMHDSVSASPVTKSEGNAAGAVGVSPNSKSLPPVRRPMSSGSARNKAAGFFGSMSGASSPVNLDGSIGGGSGYNSENDGFGSVSSRSPRVKSTKTLTASSSENILTSPGGGSRTLPKGVSMTLSSESIDSIGGIASRSTDTTELADGTQSFAKSTTSWSSKASPIPLHRARSGLGSSNSLSPIRVQTAADENGATHSGHIPGLKLIRRPGSGVNSPSTSGYNGFASTGNSARTTPRTSREPSPVHSRPGSARQSPSVTHMQTPPSGGSSSRVGLVDKVKSLRAATPDFADRLCDEEQDT